MWYYMAIKTTVSKEINITLIIFVYYSVFATCFDPVESSSSSFHDTSLVFGLYRIFIHIINCFVSLFY
jgi:hypothetical protein